MQAFYWMYFCSLFSYANSFLSSKGFTVSQIGAVLAISSILAVIIQPYIAKLLDKYETFTLKKSLLLSLGASFIVTIPMLFTTNHIVLFICYNIALCGLLTVQTYMYPFIFEYMNKGHKVNFGFSRGFGSISFAIASYFLGIVASKYSLHFFPKYFFVTCLIVIGIVFSFPTLQKDNTHKNKVKNDVSAKQFFKHNKNFCFLLIGVVCLFYTHNTFNTYLKNILESINYGIYEVGVCYLIASMIEFPTMALIPVLHKKFSYRTLFIVSSIGFTLKACILLLGVFSKSLALIYFSQLFQAFGFALYIPVSLYYVTQIVNKDEVVKAQAYLGTALILGGILGNYISAEIAQLFSVNMVIISSTIISAIGMLLFLKNSK